MFIQRRKHSRRQLLADIFQVIQCVFLQTIPLRDVNTV